MYIGWYGLGRVFIEGLRTDSLYLGNIRVSQLVAALCVIASVGLLIYFYRKMKLNEGGGSPQPILSEPTEAQTGIQDKELLNKIATFESAESKGEENGENN
jgi:prolipoprotein diacylglyceryltransferase